MNLYSFAYLSQGSSQGNDHLINRWFLGESCFYLFLAITEVKFHQFNGEYHQEELTVEKCIRRAVLAKNAGFTVAGTKHYLGNIILFFMLQKKGTMENKIKIIQEPNSLATQFPIKEKHPSIMSKKTIPRRKITMT